MGMPVIEHSQTTRNQSITDIVESVALQQTAISHILNAEGEKIQRIVAMQVKEVNNADMLKVNKSVEDMVNTLARLELVLQSKLEIFKDCLCEDVICPPIKINIFNKSGEAKVIDFGTYQIGVLSGGEITTIQTTPATQITANSLAPGFTLIGNQLIAPAVLTQGVYSNAINIGEGECMFTIKIEVSYNTFTSASVEKAESLVY
ncbi:MAG: hypothetical protein ACRCZK_06340 [Oscillospiraceae bacterium]